MQLTPVGREAGALRPGAAGQGESPQWEEVGVVVEEKKEFRSERASGVAGLFCNSQSRFFGS